MRISFNSSIEFEINEPTYKEILKSFVSIIKILLREFVEQVLNTFATEYMEKGKKPFGCERCGNRKEFIWKTHRGKMTGILTEFGQLLLHQMQIQCKRCGHKQYITRSMLGIEPRRRIPKETLRRLGLIGSLTTYRVAQKIVGMFGVVLDKMSVWRSVQELSDEVALGLDTEEKGIGEADGTGVPVHGSGKRGRELKVFVQMKKKGGVRVAGISLGKYDSEWEKLFKPLLPGIKRFKEFLLITDGDTNILKGMGKKVRVVFQRCLWHIPHQFKWYLWKDGVKRKSEEWKKAMGELLSITNVKALPHDKECVDTVIQKKTEDLNQLISYCTKMEWKQSVSYLENAKPDMFTALGKRLEGKTTSHVERVMKTVNMRVNVGKWSPRGVLNATKTRLAYYYNGFDVE